MGFFKDAVQYLFGHILRLVAVSVIPAALFAFLIQPRGLGLIFTPAAAEAARDFPAIFFMVFGRDLYTRYPYVPVIGLAMLPVAVAYTMGITEKHFKVGKLSLAHPLTNINNCISPVLKIYALLILMYTAFKVLLVSVLTLAAYILELAEAGGLVCAIVMSLISCTAFFVFLVAVRPFAFAAVIMLVYGYSFSDAVGVAFKQADGRRVQIDFALVAPFMLYVAIVALTVMLGAGTVVYGLILTALNAIIMQYAVVYVVVSIFALSGIERRDRRKYY